MIPRSLLLALLALGLVLVATAVPAPFTIDEPNYLVTVTALRAGRLTVPGTEGLPASRELLWFDPQGGGRAVPSTPVSSTAPPLYAPLAWPFSFFGWRGLVALNALAFLATAAMVFAFARRYAGDPSVAWLAVAAFALGGYGLEYAQGLWPHALAAALATAGALLAARVRDGAGVAAAVACGLLLGLAAGVRYQNVVFAAGVGLGILLLSPRRLRSAAAFAGGLAVPLAASSLLNHARLGFWNPVSKGARYLRPIAAADGEGGGFSEAVTMAWARVVDYSARPPLVGTVHATYMPQDPRTGAFLIGPVVKKAWLQSAPWIGLALVALAAAWVAGRGLRPGVRRELRAASLVVAPVLAAFAAAGVSRTDGLAFNQRYFLELVPLAAIALAWAVDGLRPDRPLDRRLVLAGGAAGALAVLANLAASPGEVARQRLLLYLPLALAAALVAAWAVARRRAGGAAAVAVTAGLCLGWALAVHLADDLRASRLLRRINLARSEVLARALPDDAALLAAAPGKDAAGALLLGRELVVVDPSLDGGEAAAATVDALLGRGGGVYAAPDDIPRDALQEALAGRAVRPVLLRPLALLEIGPAEPADGRR